MKIGVAAKIRSSRHPTDGPVTLYVGGEPRDSHEGLFDPVIVEIGPLDLVLAPDEAIALAKKLTEAAVASVEQDVHAESPWG
jgi:hypothetical protein